MARLRDGVLAALIPVLDEDYVLVLTALTVAEAVDELWIHDDGGLSAAAIGYLEARFRNVCVSRTSEIRGVASGVNRMLDACQARHILVLDGDCAFYPERMASLDTLVSGDCTYARLGFQECWGDLRHTRRGSGVLHDQPCYVDRRAIGFRATEGPPPEFYEIWEADRQPVLLPEAWFLHLGGLRDDRRLALRSLRRSHAAAGRPRPTEWERFASMTEQELHERALKFLLSGALKDREIRRLPSDLVPAVCRDHARFEFLLDSDGRPYDRLDHGWVLPQI